MRNCKQELSSLTKSLGSFVALAAISAATFAQAESFHDMAKYIPADVNAIAIINVRDILGSRVARQGDWKESQELSYASGRTFLPPEAVRFIAAKKIDFEQFSPIWEVGIMDTGGRPLSLETLAAHHRGKPDEIAGLKAIYLPTDTYVVQFDKSLFAARRPGERQAVARWIRAAASPQPLPPYIRKAIQAADAGSGHVILALDLDNVLPPAVVKAKLPTMQSVGKRPNLNLDAVANTICSVQGITLDVIFGQKAYGKLTLDFAESARPLIGIGKPLLLEVLANNGVMIDDFKDWQPKIDGKRLIIKGEFSEDGLRTIFSIFQTTDVAKEVAQANQSPGKSSGQRTIKSQAAEADRDTAVVTATRQYFREIQNYIRQIKNKDVKSLYQYGVWFQQYASKIDNLPLVNVDKDMLNYGKYVAQCLRAASAAVRTGGIRTGVGQAQARRSGTGTYGGYGYGFGYGRVPSYGNYVRSQAQERASAAGLVRAQETGAMAASVRDIVAKIEEATAEIRRQMAEKYKINL